MEKQNAATTAARVERIVLHLRGLADELEALTSAGAEFGVANDETDDLNEPIPWDQYPARLRKVLPYLRNAWHPGFREKRDFGLPRTFREALTVGRCVFRGCRDCGDGTLKPLDDDFAARGCREWIVS